MNRFALIGLFTLGSLLLGNSSAFAQLRGVTRPCYKCGIPVADYQYGFQSVAVSQLSESALPFMTVDLRESFDAKSGTGLVDAGLMQAGNLEAAEMTGEGGSTTRHLVLPNSARLPITVNAKTRLFQFAGIKTAIDQCSVSNIAVRVDDSGCWSINFLAQQNDPEFQNQRQFLEHLKRNQFHVKLRFFGAYMANAGVISNELARPQLAEVRLCPFWVERDQPQVIFRQGIDPSLAAHFSAVDRVEVELYYR